MSEVVAALWEEKFQKKKALCPLYLLLSLRACVIRLKLYGRHRQCVPGDINDPHVAGRVGQLLLNVEAQHCLRGC